jgi:hypothetical protein
MTAPGGTNYLAKLFSLFGDLLARRAGLEVARIG